MKTKLNEFNVWELVFAGAVNQGLDLESASYRADAAAQFVHNGLESKVPGKGIPNDVRRR